MPGLGHLNCDGIRSYENKILIELEFSLQFVSPNTFLERFLRVFGVDTEGDHNTQIKSFARHMCLFTQREDSFLNFKPS